CVGGVQITSSKATLHFLDVSTDANVGLDITGNLNPNEETVVRYSTIKGALYGPAIRVANAHVTIASSAIINSNVGIVVGNHVIDNGTDVLVHNSTVSCNSHGVDLYGGQVTLTNST